MNYSINPKNYLTINFKIILTLSILHLITRSYINLFKLESLTLPNIFLVDVERNIPTLYAGISLIISSVLLYFCGYCEKPKKKKLNYYLMSLLFLFLASDEIFMIHEIFGRYLRNNLETSSFFYYAWVIPYIILTILVSLYFFNFIKKMPKRIFKLIIISGILYVGGELILEIIAGYIFTINNYEINFILQLASFLEEILSMFGIVLFNYSILNLLSSKKLNIQFTD